MPETRTLPVKLTDKELKDRGRQLAAVEFERKATIEEKKKILADYNEQLKVIDGKLEKLATAVKEKAEPREVPIEYRKDVAKNTMFTIRTDTDEVIESRPLDDFDRQGELPGTESVA